MFRKLLTLTISAMFATLLPATNIVTCNVVSREGARPDKLEVRFRSISNEENRTRIAFDLYSSNAPFAIYGVTWTNCDSTYLPQEPFTLVADSGEVAGAVTEWHIAVDFPFSSRFAEGDAVMLRTSRGELRLPTSQAGELAETIALLQKDFTAQMAEAHRESRRTRWFLITFLGLALAGGGTALLLFRRRLRLKQRETENLLALLAEGTRRNRELEEQVHTLYGARLNTLNMLCNEYFEKSGSEKVRLTLYNDIERHILELRDAKSVSQLEAIVDRYMGGILAKVRRQIPQLSASDVRFLTYLYSGFSPRAVCIFMDIKVKNFYNKRSRLRERILTTDAPDRELFVSSM